MSYMKNVKLYLSLILLLVLVLTGCSQLGRKIEVSGRVEFKFSPIDSRLTDGLAYHLQNINLDPVYKYTDIMDNLEPVRVGVIDTGINPEHKYLEYEKAGYYDLRCDNEYDRAGHGTHVAGIIGAEPNPNKHVRGVAPNAELYIYKLGKETEAMTDGLGVGLNYLQKQNVEVVNISFTSNHSLYLHNVIKDCSDQGMTVIVSAGNTGEEDLTDPVNPNFPAYYEETIAVGATNAQHEWWQKSSYGKRLDLVAPGVSIDATDISTINDDYSPVNNTAYERGSGTSYSAPIITGLVTLLKGQKSDLTNQEIKSLLTTYTKKIGKKNKTGAGIPDAYRLLTRTRLEDAVLFLGEKKKDTIHKLSATHALEQGKFSFEEQVAADDCRLFIWADVDENGKINPGDYFHSMQPRKGIQAEIGITDKKHNLKVN